MRTAGNWFRASICGSKLASVMLAGPELVRLPVDISSGSGSVSAVNSAVSAVSSISTGSAPIPSNSRGSSTTSSLAGSLGKALPLSASSGWPTAVAASFLGGSAAFSGALAAAARFFVGGADLSSRSGATDMDTLRSGLVVGRVLQSLGQLCEGAQDRLKVPVTLTFGLHQDPHDGELPLDLLHQFGSPLQLLATAGLFQLPAQARQHQRAHIAASALEAVRSQAQALGVGSLLCLAQPQQALLGVEQKGIQQDRILILHDVLQGRQHVAI